MAESPSHRFGQYFGNVLEALFLPELVGFCERHGLYLDRHGARPGVRSGKKATWVDKYGNSHDLDFVIEKDGIATKQGRPLAFVEFARGTRRGWDTWGKQADDTYQPTWDTYAHHSRAARVIASP